MRNLQILFISGNWNVDDGRSSRYMSTVSELLQKKITGKVDVYNGGKLSDLNAILTEKVPNCDAVFWFPNIPVEHRSSILKPKVINPSCTLINYKRNDNGRLPYDSLKSLSISCKSDLSCEVYKDDTGHYQMRIFDCQDVIISNFTQNVVQSVSDLVSRLYILRSLTYSKIVSVGEPMELNNPDIDLVDQKFTEFGDVLKTKLSNQFIKRHLGEIAFRGYINPTTRSYDIIYVSARQLNLSPIDPTKSDVSTKYIATRLLSNKISFYSSTEKPCFNCSTYNRVMNHLPKVNYVLFSPMYIDDARFTEKCLPSGCIQQIPEILYVISKYRYVSNFAINLLGCGSLIFLDDLNQLDAYYDRLQLRDQPEYIVPEYDKVVNDDGVNKFINTLKGRPLMHGELLDIKFADGTSSVYKINVKYYKDDQGRLHKDGSFKAHIKGIPTEIPLIGLDARRV